MKRFTNTNNVTADQLTADFHALYGGHRDKCYKRAKYLLEMPIESGAPVCKQELDILDRHDIKPTPRIDSPPVPCYGDFRTKTLEIAEERITFTHSEMTEALWEHFTFKGRAPMTTYDLERILISHKNATTASLRYWVSVGKLASDGISYRLK